MAFLTVNFNTRTLSMHATNVSIILPETNEVPEHGWKTLMLLHGAGGSRHADPASGRPCMAAYR